MRTILRSRIVRHVDSVLVLEFMQAEFNASNTSKLGAAEMLAVAARFNIAVPTKEDGAAYQNARKHGASSRLAMQQVEHSNRISGVDLGNIREAGSDLSVAGGGGLVESEEEIEAGESDDAAPVAVDVLDPEVEAAAEFDVRDILQTFAQNLSGVGPKLRALALRANVKPLAPAYDTSLSHGRVGKRVDMRTMKQANIPAPLVNAREDATRLAFYDSDAPAKDAAYVWPDFTAPLLAAMARGRNIFAVGPAGTGKTTFAEQVAAYYGREFVRISCDDQTEAATLVGMTLGKDETHKGVWQDGQLARAIRKPGAMILVDEPSVARAGALMVLQAVLDDNRALHVAETGEVVRVAPDVLFFFADNTNGTGDRTGQYEATRIINRATLDRLSQTVTFGYLDASTEAKALQARTKCSAKLANQLVKFAALTRTKAMDGTLRTGIGFRRLRALAECMSDGAGASFAFAVCVLNGATFEDAERLRQMWTAEFHPANAGVEA